MSSEALTPEPGPSPLVGRDRELAELADGLKNALSGKGRLFLISGEPGIGKSRLADELATEGRLRGAQILWGRCWEAGGAPAYWPWVQVLRSLIRDLDPETLGAEIGAGGPDIAQMLPEVRELVPDLPGPASVDPDTARFRLFDAVTTFLRKSSEARPLVLIVDDLHVADTPSLLLLRFLAGELADGHVLVVGTYRDTELTREHPLTSTIAELLRHLGTRRLPLGGLTQSDVARFMELTTGESPPPSIVAAVHEETDGNPLFMGEVVRLLAAEGRLNRTAVAPTSRITLPVGVREVIARRLARLSEKCTEVLTLASVLGREFNLDALAQLSEQSHDDLLKVLEEASDARVISEVPGTLGRLRFSHALVRDTLYDELPPTRRLRLHREVGEALEALYGGRAEPHLAELAHHFVQAAPGGDADVLRAVGYARRAGEGAVRSLAYEEAARLFEMTLDALELGKHANERLRSDILLALGDAQARAGHEPKAKETFLQAAQIAERLNEPEKLGRAALGYGGRFVWARAGTDRHIVPLLEKALARLDASDSTLRVRLMARLAGALRDEHLREPRDSLSHEALEMARRIGDPATLVHALDGRAASLLWPENPQQRIGLASELVRGAEEAGNQEKSVQGRYYRLMALLELGDTRAVKEELDVIDALARDLRQPPQLWLVAVTRATLALFEGRFADAGELIPQALTLGERAQSSDAVLSYRIQRFSLSRELGGLENLEPIIKQSGDEYPARPMFRCMLAYLLADVGRLDDARQAFEELAMEGFAALPLSNEWLFSMSILVEVSERLGDVARARIMYDQLLPYAAYNGATADYISTGAVSRYLGVLASMLSRWEDAAGHFEGALDMNERMGARPWAAYTRHDLARMLLDRDGPGDRDQAAELLAEVMEACGDMGMVVLEKRVSMLLEDSMAGVVPEAQVRPDVSGPSRPSVFRREGEYWSILYEGEAFRLKDLKGLRYIARLLAEPSREFHVLDLVAAEEGTTIGKKRGEPGLEASGLGDAGEILDEQAKAAYRRRLNELEDDAEEARSLGDSERASRAEEERDRLTGELARAVGLGGRDRRAGSAAERARVSVTRAIRAALAKVQEHNPALGHHLDRTIRTGTFCSYAPDPRVPIGWRF